VQQERQVEQGAVRCFKCPKERGTEEPGWHFLDPSKLRGTLRRHVVFVCPTHYEQFAAGERARWRSLGDSVACTEPTLIATTADGHASSETVPPMVAHDPEPQPPFSDDLELSSQVIAAT
jgi:hypothetical protein